MSDGIFPVKIYELQEEFQISRSEVDIYFVDICR